MKTPMDAPFAKTSGNIFEDPAKTTSHCPLRRRGAGTRACRVETHLDPACRQAFGAPRQVSAQQTQSLRDDRRSEVVLALPERDAKSDFDLDGEQSKSPAPPQDRRSTRPPHPARSEGKPKCVSS
jgi:hypothetical protein